MGIEFNRDSIRSIAVAQKLILLGILVNIGLFAISVLGQGSIPALQVLALPVYLCAIGLQLYGCFRLARGLGWNVAITVVCLILMFVPIIGLLTLLILNQKATTALRAAGLHVGLLGVRTSELP